MATNKLPKDALAIQEAAERYTVARRTLDRWIHDGRLRGYRLTGDRKTYVRASMVERLMKEPPAVRGRKGKWREPEERHDG